MKLIATIVACALGAIAADAGAVIQIKISVGDIYQTSGQVIVGKVTAANQANRVVDMAVSETAKGATVGEEIRIQINKPEEVFAATEIGSPVVVFVGKSRGGEPPTASVHLADTWLYAVTIPNAAVPSWRVEQRRVDLDKAFPGTSGAVVRLVEELKANKPTLLNKAEENVLSGGVEKLADLKIKNGMFLAGARLTADREPQIIVGAGDGIYIFSRGPGGYEDVTRRWGISGTGPIAVGDVNGDGKVDVVVGSEVWLNDGSKLIAPQRVESTGEEIIATSVIDAGRDRLGHVVTVGRSGGVRVLGGERSGQKLWEDGKAILWANIGNWGEEGEAAVIAARAGGLTRYSLGISTRKSADGQVNEPSRHADFARLMGEKFESVYKANNGKLAGVKGTVIDVNGDGRMDYLVMADGGGMLLINRGFGAFFVSTEAVSALRPKEGKAVVAVSGSSCLAAVDWRGDKHEELLVLTSEGELYLVKNRP